MGVTVTPAGRSTLRAGIMVHDGRDNVIENNIIVSLCNCAMSMPSQIEFTGYGWWRSYSIDNWCKQYHVLKDLPRKEVASSADPRTVPLPTDAATAAQRRAPEHPQRRRPQPQCLLRFATCPSSMTPATPTSFGSRWDNPSRPASSRSANSSAPTSRRRMPGLRGAPGQIPGRTDLADPRPSTHDTAIATGRLTRARAVRTRVSPIRPRLGTLKAQANLGRASPALKSAEIAVEPGEVDRIAGTRFSVRRRPDTAG